MRPLVLFVCLLLIPIAGAAQTPPPSAPAEAQDPAQQPPEQSDPDTLVDPLQPDFTLAALPTTLRMPRGKWAFRVTHRFTRSLGAGDFGDLLSDFFGFDGGSQVGLELRYGILPGTQLGVYRTSDRTTQLFLQKNLLNERDGARAGLDALVTWEGDDNLSEHHQSALGVVASKNLGRFAAVYAQPLFVANTSRFTTGDNNTLLLGLGTRVRLRPSTYVVAEAAPRLAGYDPGTTQMSVALELRAGGHAFQLNFSNGFGTTLGQLSRGGVSTDSWFIGFNISRKFFD